MGIYIGMIFPYSLLITSKTRSWGSKSRLGSESLKVFMGLGFGASGLGFRAYGLGHWTSTSTNITYI